jgi:hypothetical protein
MYQADINGFYCFLNIQEILLHSQLYFSTSFLNPILLLLRTKKHLREAYVAIASNSVCGAGVCYNMKF